MKAYLKTLALTALCLALPAFAVGPNGVSASLTVQNANSNAGSCTALSCAQLNLQQPLGASTIFTGADAKYATVSLQVTGTWSGTITFQYSQDEGATWINLPLLPAPLVSAGAYGTPATSTTANGNWVAPVSGYTSVRAVMSTYTSGTAVVVAEAYTAPLAPATPGAMFVCSTVNASATTLANFTTGCTAPGAGLSLYITDISASASVIATTTADQQLELKYGTGANCGTGTTQIWDAYNVAFSGAESHYLVPIKIPANNALCTMDAAVGSKSFTVTGYIAP